MEANNLNPGFGVNKMYAELDHMVSLVMNGNSFLDGDGVLKGYYHYSSLDSVKFACNAKIIATTVEGWYKYLKRNNCRFINLKRLNKSNSDYNLSAYVGGNKNWVISCIFDDYFELWVPEWVNKYKNNMSAKWIITYFKVDKRMKMISTDCKDLKEAKTKLNRILQRIGDFALEINFEGWKKFFDKGIEALQKVDDDIFLPKFSSFKPDKRLMQ